MSLLRGPSVDGGTKSRSIKQGQIFFNLKAFDDEANELKRSHQNSSHTLNANQQPSNAEPITLVSDTAMTNTVRSD